MYPKLLEEVELFNYDFSVEIVFNTVKTAS